MEFSTKTTKRMLLATAAGLLLGTTLGFAVKAKAADLGGDCCTDLEERVAALEATSLTHGTRKMTLQISGWVNAGGLYWEDHGVGTDQRDVTFHDRNSGFAVVNTDTAQTRFVLTGENRVSEGFSTGFSIGVRPWGDKLGSISQIDTDPSQDNIDVRDTYVFLDFKRIGKFLIGQQVSAADAAFYQDQGGSSTWISNINPGAWNNSFYLRDSYGNLSTVQWGNVLGEMSDSQAPRLAYYSRDINGFQAAASAGDNTWALALYYAHKYGTVSVSAGVGYDVSAGAAALGSQAVGTGLIDDYNSRLAKLGASASVYESRSGLYGTVGYSRVSAAIEGRNDATNLYGKLGWRRNVTTWGETNLFGEADRSTQELANGINANMMGVGLTQDIDATNSVLYVGYRHSNLENGITGATLVATSNQTTCGCSLDSAGPVQRQSFDAVLGGMVVQF
jgi:hypothetical protein